MSEKIKILSIDGGGTRGLFPATLLACLEKELKESGQLQANENITKYFDVVVGAATGGIIAAALAAGLSAADISSIYLHRAKYILPKPWFRRVWNILNLFAPRYPNGNLKKLLEEKFEGKTLGQVPAGPVFLFPTLELNPNLPAEAMKAFKVVVYNNREHPDELLSDVALKTSAAIMNLPIYEGFVEGGNYANDPALVGFFYALKQQKAEEGASKLENIQLLSLGCGSDEKSFIPSKKIGNGNWGMARWMGHLAPMVIETKMVASQYYLQQALHADQYLRINVNYNAPQSPQALRGKKLAIDVRDDAQLRAIHEYAYSTFEAEKSRIKNFIGL